MVRGGSSPLGRMKTPATARGFFVGRAPPARAAGRQSDYSGGCERPVVVAVIVVRVMEPAGDQIVDVVSVRHRVVSALLAVCVRRITVGEVSVALRVGVVDRDHMFVDVIVVNMMEVAVMDVVGVTVMLDGSVATTRPVLVGVVSFVDLVRHGRDVRPPLVTSQGPRNPINKRTTDRPATVPNRRRGRPSWPRFQRSGRPSVPRRC